VRSASQTVRLPLEDYVAGVVAAEAAIFESHEALKAMAVAARTYAVFHSRRHASEGFDLCDTTHCQAFRPPAPERVRRAAADTEDELVWYGGRPAAAFYHRHCGGATASARELWPELAAPYLAQRTDTFCLPRGSAAWEVEIPQAHSFEILRRTASGRAAEVRVNGTRMTAAELDRRWTGIRSNDYHALPRPGGWLLRGYGFGHGVGLCQTGAEARGKAGHGYGEILAFYYPGTKIGISAQGLRWARGAGERVEVFAASEAEAQALGRAADRAVIEAERRLGTRIAARPQVRAYPHAAIFRDATGEPGWVAASTRGATVRMQPPALLRSKGILESTLLHEMLHVALNAQARVEAPGWFREGVVLHLAGEPGNSAEYRAARRRVDALIARHGRATVLGWVASGLPPAAAQAQ
jgi:stage II sporulation protein D